MADSSDRKTLTLKRATSAADGAPETARQRSGARARQVAQRRQAEGPTPRTAAPAAPPRNTPKPTAQERRAAESSPRERPSSRSDGRPASGARPPAGARATTARPTTPPRATDPASTPKPTAQRAQPSPEKPHAERKARGPRHRPSAAAATRYPAFAPCPQGLEAALATELRQLGFETVRTGRAGCHFETDWIGMMRANLHSRLATRILLQVAQADIQSEHDLLGLAHDTPWERWFGPEQRLRVDTSAIRSPVQSLQYCTLRTKDGICDRLREREGARPSIDTVRPDARVHLFLDANSATLYLDTSGESLFKRGWRFDKGEAPLRENLAAGLLALAQWPHDAALLDPFCGGGTILIEAAYLALNVPPGIQRPFAFERLRHHDTQLWADLKQEARSRIRPQLTQALIGSDIDPAAIASARSNAARAGLTPDAITFEVRDARDIRPPDGPAGWIVTNPPYGDRMRLRHDRNAAPHAMPDATPTADADPAAAALWRDFAQTLKTHFDGWQAHLITTDRQLPQHLRLTARSRTPLYNGALDCRFFAFDVVGGSYRQRL